MDFKFNVNHYVKVKLTEYGIAILKQQHEELNDEMEMTGVKGFGNFKVDIDEDGYTKFQLHSLMNKFGHLTTNGQKIPFETEIIITEGELI